MRYQLCRHTPVNAAAVIVATPKTTCEHRVAARHDVLEEVAAYSRVVRREHRRRRCHRGQSASEIFRAAASRKTVTPRSAVTH